MSNTNPITNKEQVPIWELDPKQWHFVQFRKDGKPKAHKKKYGQRKYGEWDRILQDTYQWLYANAFPPADFRKLMEESPRKINFNGKEEIQIPYEKHILPTEVMEHIIKEMEYREKMSDYECRGWSPTVVLGCSPYSIFPRSIRETIDRCDTPEKRQSFVDWLKRWEPEIRRDKHTEQSYIKYLYDNLDKVLDMNYEWPLSENEKERERVSAEYEAEKKVEGQQKHQEPVE